MEQTDEVIGIVVTGVEGGGKDFAGEDPGADAMGPEVLPRQGGRRDAFQVVQLFDHRGGHRKLA